MFSKQELIDIDLELDLLSNVENKVRRWFGARLLAGAVCMAILVVTASILLPNDSTPVFVTDILSSDELEMQELMLLQDEILFSQL